MLEMLEASDQSLSSALVELYQDLRGGSVLTISVRLVLIFVKSATPNL